MSNEPEGGPVSLDAVTDRLQDLTVEFDDDDLPTAVPSDEAHIEDALTLLELVFVAEHGGSADPRAIDRAGRLLERVALLIGTDETARREFVARVLFDVRSPVLYARLAPVVTSALSLDELTAAIVDRLDAGSDRERANALDMQYYLFGRERDRRLGRERGRRIADAVERLRGRDLDERARRALDAYRPPLDPIDT